MMAENKVKLTTLWQRRSTRTGKTYFSGYLGSARVVVLKDERATVPEGADGIWSVYVEEKQEQAEVPRRRESLRQPVGEGGQRISTKPNRLPEKPANPEALNDPLDDILPLR
jgi:hypothetical protein